MRKLTNSRSKLRVAILLMIIYTIAATLGVMAAGVTTYSFAEEFVDSADAYEAYLADYVSDGAGGTRVYSGKLKDIMKNPGTGGSQNVFGVNVSDEVYKQIGALAKDVYSRENYRIKMDQMTSGFDISADTSAAGNVLSGFRGLIQTVVGLGAWVVTAGMTLFTIFDFMYITIPVFRNKSQEVAQSNPSMGRTDAKSGGGTRPKFVTFDAHKAVQKEEDTGKNAVGIYLFRRIWAFVIIAISLYILITGNINLITGLAINWVSGILSALQGMAG